MQNPTCLLSADLPRSCPGCQQCINAFGALAADIPEQAVAAEIAEAVLTTCTGVASYTAKQCEALSRAVGNSPGGNLGRRPGAVCRRLGSCAADAPCSVTVQSSVTRKTVTKPVDTCTVDGVEGGLVPGTKSNLKLSTGQCFSDSDCSKGQLCERGASAPLQCSCNNGLDVCRPVGSCTSYCKSSEAKAVLDSINAKVGVSLWGAG